MVKAGSGMSTNAKLKCFEGKWVDLEGAKLLLYRLKYSRDLTGLVLNSAGAFDEPDKLIGYVKSFPDMRSVRSECDIWTVETAINTSPAVFIFSNKRIRCIPLTPTLEVVKSIELLLRSTNAQIEVDALQRNIVPHLGSNIDSGFYTMCLVGEVLSQDIVAIGIELETAGRRIIMASELTQTSVSDVPRAEKRRTRRRKKRRLKK